MEVNYNIIDLDLFLIPAEKEMNWKSETLASIFGMLVILVTFGDRLPNLYYVGNLDTIFGPTWWYLMDVIYPLASIAVFIFHGWINSGIRIHYASILLFLVFLVGLAMINIDDIFFVLNYTIKLPDTYWVIAHWLYPFIALISFFSFGWICRKLRSDGV
jgi:hypothetical protein